MERERCSSEFVTKLAVLVKTIKDELWTASISETILQILESTAELLQSEANAVVSASLVASISAAYCSVAVECTRKYLEVQTSHPQYFNAIHRIWNTRVHNIQPSSFLYSVDLLNWKNDFEASLSNSQVMETLVTMVTSRYDAIKSLKVYLKEADTLQNNIGEFKTTVGVKETSSSAVTKMDGNQGGETPSSRDGVKFHLPSPKRNVVSPLKLYEENKLTKRRKPNKWTEKEQDDLKKAVTKFGEGNWKMILDSRLYSFNGRIPGDLKDKWRNMARPEKVKRRKNK